MKVVNIIKRLVPALMLTASAAVYGAANKTTVCLTSPLDNAAWNASQWISVVDAPVVTGKVYDDYNNRAADGASWFVSTVGNGKKVKSAKWMTTALGIYELYVNGQTVGNEVMKPGFTHSYKTKRSYTYDITSALDCRSGARNQLAVQVTPGWWGDKIITPAGSEGMRGKKCAFRGVLELTYTDGTKQCFGTDTENWKAGIAGPVKHAAIFDGEIYDAREPLGFQTPEKLSSPEINDEFHGIILPTNGAEIYHREDLAFDPIEIYVWQDTVNQTEELWGTAVIRRHYKPGETITLHPGENLVVDFGQNASAVPDFVFSAKEGTHLKCLPAEILNDGNGDPERGMDHPGGSIHRENLRTPDDGMSIDYTFGRSDKPVHYRPHYSFFGYRYIGVAADGDVTITSLKSIPITSITHDMESGTLVTGNESVNSLISNAIWSQRSNYLSVPTDCPQRNERLGWMADCQIFSETGTFFADTRSFFHKWMHDVRDTQSPGGGYPGVAPFGQYGCREHEMMRIGWADGGVITPWTIWKQFDDKEIISQHWASMEKYMDHVAATKYDHATLQSENYNYQWADWLSFEALESCGNTAFDKEYNPLPDAIDYWNYLAANYWIIDAGMMCDMGRAIGNDVAKYEAMKREAKEYIREKFLNENGEFKTAVLNTMQTPALFALKNNIVEGHAKENIIARLRQNFADHGNCLQTGILGTSILMDVLTENGMSDIAYELLFQRKNPSWLYSVDNGATTIWERWNSYTKEKGMGPAGMNSFNHYAYGAVCAWIWKTAAGIAADPTQPGFKHIIMRPLPDKRLGSVDATYRSAAGTIKSAWHYKGDKWIWKFTIPKGATATVTLPGENTGKEYKAGTYTITK